MKVKIYGRSDDCIEVDGDIHDEYSAYDGWKWLHFGDGTVVKIGYAMEDAPKGKGWHIEVVAKGTAVATALPPEMEDDEHYTDVLQIEGDLWRVRCCDAPDGPSGEQMLTFFDNLEGREIDNVRIREAYDLLTGWATERKGQLEDLAAASDAATARSQREDRGTYNQHRDLQ